MPLGINRTDLNSTGTSFKNGDAVTLPKSFGNPAVLPKNFGSPVTLPLNVANSVTWTPAPSHFGNNVVPPSVVTTGLIAQYKMTDASGTTLIDSSGAGNNATLNTSASGKFDNGGLWCQQGMDATLPAAVGGAWVSCCIFCDNSPIDYKGGDQVLVQNDSFTGVMVGLQKDSNAYLFSSLTNAGTFINNRATAAIPISGMPMMGMLSVACDVSADGIYYNDGSSSVVFGAAATDAVTTTCSTDGGSAANLRNPTTYYFLGDKFGGGAIFGRVYYALFYNRKITQAEVAQNYNFILNELASRGTTFYQTYQDSMNHLVGFGDSNVGGAGTTLADYRQSFIELANLKGEWKRVVLGVGSITAHQYAQQVSGGFTSAQGLGSQNVAVVMVGTNDINFGGATAAGVHSYIQTMCQNLRSGGWKVIVCTLPSVSWEGTIRASLNTLIRNNYVNYADGLADFGANANIGANGAFANATYFLDGVHLTTTGQTVAAGILQPVVDAIYSGPFLQLKNSDFEMPYLGTPNGSVANVFEWTVTGAQGATQNWPSFQGIRFAGHQYATVNNGVAENSISQTMNDTFTANAVYTISAVFRNFNPASSYRISLMDGVTELAFIASTTGTSATPSFQYTVPAVAGPIGHTPSIKIASPAGATQSIQIKSIRVSKA